VALPDVEKLKPIQTAVSIFFSMFKCFITKNYVMRNCILLFVLALGLSTTLSAQLQKGTILASGEISFNSTSNSENDDFSSTDFSLTPRAGYFFTDNFVAGALVSFSSSNTEDTNFELEQTMFGFGPFVRYYLDNGLYGEVAYDFVSSTLGDADAVTGSWITPRVGYAAFLNDHVSVEPSIFYSIGGGDLYENVSNFGIAIGFGIYLY